jgi:uncharacterized damage-inducible protein DinB
LHSLFLNYSVEKLTQFHSRIESCLDRLTYEQVWAREADSQNAIGNLVLHLAGNVRQWIVSGVGGQPNTRERDQEFAARGDVTVSELKEKLRTALDEALEIIRNLPLERLSEPLNVQGYHLTVLEGIYHVVEHFAQHTGQILFATKLFTGQDLGFYRHLSNPSHGENTP